MDYSRVFGSKFPNSLIEVGTKKDVDDSVLALVNQYQNYMQAGKTIILYKRNCIIWVYILYSNLLSSVRLMSLLICQKVVFGLNSEKL